MAERQLIVLRHGKTETGDGKDDFDRVLRKRGIRDSERVGLWLRNSALVPDDVVSSPALRAQQTAETVCESSGVGAGIVRYDRRLYLAPVTTLLTVLRAAPPECTRLMIVGHNPGMEALVQALGGPTAFAGMAGSRMPTAAVAVIDLSMDWPHIEAGAGRLSDFVTPADID